MNLTNAQWAVDEGALQNSGATVSGLSAGAHTLSFSPESSYDAPTNEMISIVAGSTISIAATYTALPQTGALEVTLNVPGAQWALDGGAWQNSGAALSGLSAGSHTFSFSAESGFTTPGPRIVSIVASATALISATYVAIPQTGSLVVTLTPTNAQWAVDNGPFQDSGATVSGLSPGPHTISFSPLSGFTAPSDESVFIAANQTTLISATYVEIPPSGALEVTLNMAGAQWAVDAGVWQSSGAIVTGLFVGSHTVTFATESGYTTPASETVSIAENQTNSITANYAVIPQTGAVQVTMNLTNAQWAVDGGAFQDSGATVSGLPVGLHTLSFSAESGYTEPTNATISVAANETNSIDATYVAIPQTGAVEVTLNVAGAQWSVDDGVWQNSGTIVSGMSVGSHTLNFSAVSGYTTPASQTVSIADNQTNSVAVAYAAVVQDFSAAMAGTYTGLFYPADTVADSTSGMINGLIVKTNGRYSGRVLIAGIALPITGTFDVTGHASQVIVRGPRSGGALNLDMAITENGGLPAIAGTVSGTNGGPWVANLAAGRAAPTTESYQYTLLFAPPATASAGSPPGFGYASIANHKGTAAVIGALADARNFSQNIPVSADGSLPLYFRFGPHELALGWVTNLYSPTPSGQIAWIKGGSLASLNYKEGFTNLVSVMGSIWTNAAPEHAAIGLRDAPLTVFDGGWTEPQNYVVTLASNNTVAASGTALGSGLTGLVNPRTGLLQLTIGRGRGKVPQTAFGAVLQIPGVAAGYFMTSTNTGAFELQPNLFE
jgi:uncharacterized protein YukJ